MDGAEFLRDVVRSAEAIGPLTRSEDVFRAAMDAWRAGDADSFQRLLGELEIIDRCELVCGWLCSKDCVLECLELCGPPPQEVPAIREFAEVVARITGDEELVERLAEAVEERDAQAFNALVDELKIRPFCHLLCHWVCVVRCRLTCGLVCPPPPPIRLHLEDELVRAGQALRRSPPTRRRSGSSRRACSATTASWSGPASRPPGSPNTARSSASGCAAGAASGSASTSAAPSSRR